MWLEKLVYLFNPLAYILPNFWKIIDFFVDIVKFVVFAWRSLINLFTWLFDSLFSNSLDFFLHLLDVFDYLSIFLGSYTIYFVWFFVFICVIIIFQFLFRVFTWKYAIFNRKR